MSNKVLVIAAHPDDEVLGCGGTIARHAKQGDEVHVLIVAEGITSREGSEGSVPGQLAELRKSAAEAASILGAQRPEFLGLPDNRLDSVPLLDVIKPIETAVSHFAPQVIYTHHGGDLNVDHRIVHAAVITACRPIPGRSVHTVLCFEVASSTEWQAAGPHASFSPNWSVDVSATLPKKLAALRAYGSEMRSWPHSRSLEAQEHLARWRGASVGLEAAEAFVLARALVR